MHDQYPKNDELLQDQLATHVAEALDSAENRVTNGLGSIVLTAVQESAERPPVPTVLPNKQQTEDIFLDRLQNDISLPNTYRVTYDEREANVLYASALHAEPNIDKLKTLFVEQTAQKAAEEAWWMRTSKALKDLGAQPDQAENLTLVQRHDVAVVVDDKPIDQGFEIFEVGAKEEDEAVVGAVVEALEVVDQFSGGLLAASPQKPQIVLLNGVKLKQNRSGGEFGGTAVPGVVVLNVPALKEMAAAAGADFHALLATSTVHEILGHDLERLTHERTGRYFDKHFVYSREREEGEIFVNVHKSVVPKDEAVHSHPVREYGRTNLSEDFATSVDAAVAAAMGWSKGLETLPRFKSKEDAYRSELVLNLMQKAAKLAVQYDHTPGVVGSDVRYQTDENGVVTGVEPLRKIAVTTTPGNVALEQEIHRMTNAYQPDTFVVSPGDVL